jgi:hypothetical protein
MLNSIWNLNYYVNKLLKHENNEVCFQKKRFFFLFTFFNLGDDPRASLPNYVYTEQAPAINSIHEEKENGSQTDTEHPMVLNTTDQSDMQLDTSSISTRNSAKRNKINLNQRSTITRRQAKEKELINGHNEVRIFDWKDSISISDDASRRGSVGANPPPSPGLEGSTD